MSTENTISGSWIVDEISKMHINSIPQAWYKTIRQKKAPHAMAILILWELLYWYKWTEIRDEQTDMVIGYKKKFKADLLQRSYGDIAEKFGITKRQATDILYFLRDEGIVTIDLRTINVNGMRVSNVLFIGLNPKKIAEISDERNNITTEKSDSSNEISTKLSTEKGDSSNEIPLEGSRNSDRQIQSITQSNSQTNSQSISSPQPAESSDKDSLPQEENSNSHSVSLADCNNKSKKTKKESVSFKQEEYTQVFNAYFENCKTLFQQGKITVEKPVIPVTHIKKTIKLRFLDYGVDKVLQAVKDSVNNSWLVTKTNYSITALFSEKIIADIINGTCNSSFNKTAYQKASPQRQWSDEHLIF